MLEWIIGILIVIILFFVIVMIIDGNRFVIREYTIKTNKINKEYKLVLLADLHNKTYGNDNAKLLAAVDKVEPDMILCAGDIMTTKPKYSLDVASSLMKKLSAKYPVYYGIGNHEYRMKLYPEFYKDSYDTYTDELRNYGIKVLDNETTQEEDLCITGVSIDRKYYKRFQKTVMEESYLTETIGTTSADKYRILIAHNPEYFDRYAQWGADLVVSGHIHGGVMRLPFLGGVISPKPVLFPKYDGGIFYNNNSTMVLSRGLGMHTFPIRIFNPGELVVIHLLPCK